MLPSIKLCITQVYYFQQTPQNRTVQNRFRLTHIKRKSAGICTCYSSHASKAFALPTVVRTSNAEIAHADMYNDKAHLMFTHRRTMVYNIPRRHLPLLFPLTTVQKVAKFLIRQRQKRSKRLFLNICMFPPTLRLSKGLSVGETIQNYKIKFGNENINGEK